jgi:hypothetical protein
MVRQDHHHVPIFLSFLFGAAGLLILGLAADTARWRRDQVLVALACVVAAVVWLGSGWARFHETGAAITGLFTGEAGRAVRDPLGFLARLPIGRYAETARANQRVAFAAFVLPPTIRQQLPGRTVDIVPWSAGYAGANTFEWRPRPVFQSYAAYTPALDHLNARHFTGASAPDVVLYEPRTLDRRHPFLDEPATWREIRCRYSLRTATGHYFLLERSSEPRCAAPHVASTMEAALGADVPIPAAQRDLFVAVDVRPSWQGRIAALLYRAPPVALVVRWADGIEREFRLVAGTAGDGLALGHLPRNLDEVRAVLQGDGPLPLVTSIRLITSARWAYRPTASVRIFTVGLATPEAVSRAIAGQ